MRRGARLRVLQVNSFRHKYRSDVALHPLPPRVVAQRGEEGKDLAHGRRADGADSCAYCGAEATDTVPNGIDLLANSGPTMHDTCVSCCVGRMGACLAPGGLRSQVQGHHSLPNEQRLWTRFIPFRQVRGAGGRGGDPTTTQAVQQVQVRASRRKIEFALTMEEFMQKKREGCTYCAPPPHRHRPLDNALAYTFDNTCGSCKMQHDEVGGQVRVPQPVRAPRGRSVRRCDSSRRTHALCRCACAAACTSFDSASCPSQCSVCERKNSSKPRFTHVRTLVIGLECRVTPRAREAHVRSCK